MRRKIIKLLESNIFSKKPLLWLKLFIFWMGIKMDKSSRIGYKYNNEISKIMNRVFNDEWSAAFGCLIRIFRDGSIKGDDIDLMVPSKIFDKKKMQLLKENGMNFYEGFVTEDGRRVELRFKYRKIIVDIFMWNDGLLDPVINGDDSYLKIYNIPWKETQEFKFGREQKSRVPKDTTIILEKLFGETWETPIGFGAWLHNKNNNITKLDATTFKNTKLKLVKTKKEIELFTPQ